MFSRPPPTGTQASYVNRLSAGRNLRSIVMLFAFISGLYSLLSAIGNFRSISIDRHEQQSKLATFSLVMGILCIVVFAFEAFGIVATMTQRHHLVRIYAMLSFVTVLIATGGGLLEIIIHFTMKSNIINECEQLIQGDQILYPFGFLGPISHTFVNQQDATDWCTDEWNHNSWSDIIELLILIILSTIFSLFSFAYYRQLQDPTSAANVIRTPIRGPPAFPSHYNPAYNASVPSLGYQYGPGQESNQQFAPPPGPPPTRGGADSKPPGYAGYGYDVDDNAKENPFADFDEVRKVDESEDEHDVTSRPAPGGRNTFA